MVSEVTPLEKMLQNAGPLRQDGSDKFFGFENVSVTSAQLSTLSVTKETRADLTNCSLEILGTTLRNHPLELSPADGASLQTPPPLFPFICLLLPI